MEVVKRIIADVLYRHLGSYVDGLTKESIGNGIWEGNLELRGLRLRAESLAVLCENFGLDLPVTVTAGYVGLLCVEVPWTHLQSQPVRIILTDVAIVASPVSDGEQKDLGVREKRLRTARLAIDESVRDVKFSLRNAPADKIPGADESSKTVQQEPTSSSSGWRFGFGLTWWKKYVMRIVDNIQIQIENVIVQYEDASSVRGRPYTCSLALDSLNASAADSTWSKAFNTELSPVVQKIAQLEGLVLNWEPGVEGNELKPWIDAPNSERRPGHWAGYVRSCKRHAIKPMDGELRMSIVRPKALAEAVSSNDPSKHWIKQRPRVEIDLCVPDIAICLDDFNYHTLLSTVMYLSDIDRRVRPTTAKGRWQWAVDRLLPRFKERRKAMLLLHDVRKLQERRELREEYIKARNSVVTARRKGRREDPVLSAVVERIESEETYEDILLFRDMADRILLDEPVSNNDSRGWSFWSPFRRTPISQNHLDSENGALPSTESRRLSLDSDSSYHDTRDEELVVSQSTDNDESTVGIVASANSLIADDSPSQSRNAVFNVGIDSIPRLRVAFLLERGGIKLSRGGFPNNPTPMASLEFRELRLGITTAAVTGFVVEAVLGAFEAHDLVKQTKFWYARLPRVADEVSKTYTATNSVDFGDEKKVSESHENTHSFSSTTSRSYPTDVGSALQAIRSKHGNDDGIVYESYSSSKSSPSNSIHGLDDNFNDPANDESDNITVENPLKYIAALRIRQVCSDDEDATDQTRLTMDVAIGGMEVVLDGPDCAFISALSFWSPREKLPSIMSFLSRSAAPRLAFLRMEVQKAILEHKEPMCMDIHIRAPRFVIAPTTEKSVAVIVDLGTFAMTTSTEPAYLLPLKPTANADDEMDSQSVISSKRTSARHCDIQYTDYQISCSDLCVFLASNGKSQIAERLVRQFSLNLTVQVLHNPSYVEALTNHLGSIDIAKVKLKMILSSLSTSISHKAFRQALAVVKAWNGSSNTQSSLECYSVGQSTSGWSEDEVTEDGFNITTPPEPLPMSSLISFEMLFELEDLNLELRDASSRRIVTVSSLGTLCKLSRRPKTMKFTYRVHSFTVIDGSRGATAPYQQLAHAGSSSSVETNRLANKGGSLNPFPTSNHEDEGKAFVTVTYISDLSKHEQTIAVEILALQLVCVRETYLALADFFYLVEKPSDGSFVDNTQRAENHLAETSEPNSNAEVPTEPQGEYSDPFNALGMTTVSAARKFREKANIGMEMSKQAFANRGKLVVTAVLDGVGLVLVSGEGAIASFKVGDCKSQLIQVPNGAVEASGQLGHFEVRDLTSAFDVYSRAVEYNRASEPDRNPNESSAVDGWTLKIPETGGGDPWLTARLRNLKVVYLQRFVIILKKYFDVLRENLRPVLEIKGGIAEVFDDDLAEDLSALTNRENRLRLNCVTENINVIIPRHSQSPHEALRFIVGHSAVTNEDEPAPGYKFGVQVATDDVTGYVLYDGSCGYRGDTITPSVSVKTIDPHRPPSELIPFTENVYIAAKLDLWRRRRVPQVVINPEGVPVLKEGEDERKYDPTLWRPTIRVRICAPKSMNADLCEAQYSILYFCFTENLIERPDIEFTDIVRGLKTPVLPARKPIRPIMFSSHPMPPNYQILFEVASLTSTIKHGGDPTNDSAKLIRTELRHIHGTFEYGVDYHMSVEVSGSLHSLIDIRPHAVRPNVTIISTRTPKSHVEESELSTQTLNEENKSVTLTWDRPHGHRANIMVVMSDINVIVVPELFRDLGLLTTPGFPYLNSSAPAPLLRFNGRQLILTVSRPQIWLMAHQYSGDSRSLVLRGDIIAKVEWAAVTGRNTFELAAHGLNINLSNKTPVLSESTLNFITPSSLIQRNPVDDEVPLLYPSDISLKYQGSGYDPPTTPGGEPTKAPGSELSLNAESLLLRVDVNDIPLILAIGSRSARLRPSVLSVRPPQPGRFDEWIDKGEEGDAKLFATVSVPHARLIFTDEVSGYYIPIMELRVGHAVIKSSIWVTNAKFEFSVDLFNDEKGWWEPGLEPFSFEVAASRGKSGSEAIQLRAEQTIDANISPTTVSGAFRVVKTLKSAVEDLLRSLKTKTEENASASTTTTTTITDVRQAMVDSQRPSVAAFCVKNETGRSVSLWLPYDSMRRNLKGNGAELEVEMPTEDGLWSSGVAHDRIDSNRDRRLSMQCTVSMTGYDPVSLSAAEVGSRIVYFFRETNTQTSFGQDKKRDSIQGVLTLVWTVAMRNGVPVGSLRSLFRIVNETRTVFGVKVGQSSRTSRSSTDGHRYSQDSAMGSGEDPIWIKAGESWSVPVHAVERTICLRPIVLEAPDMDTPNNSADGAEDSSTRGRVVYSYHWSDPLSRFSSLLTAGLKLDEILRSDESSTKSTRSLKLSHADLPSLSCRAIHHGNPFTILLVPRIGVSSSMDMTNQSGKPWLDIVLRAPFLISNALPRPVSIAITNTRLMKSNDRNSYVSKEWIEPLRTVHIHTAGTDLSRLSVGIGYDNCPVTDVGESDLNSLRKARNILGVHKDLGNLVGIPVGSHGDGNCKFLAKFDRSKANISHKLMLYSEFWIRNRSCSDLMFKNAKTNGELSNDVQEIFLRSRPPGVPADKFIAFTGSWIAFRSVESTQSTWVSLPSDIFDIEMPELFTLGKVSLIAEVRPARGEFHRTLIVTIRNAIWIENRTDVTLQWCQPAALDAGGNALTSNVHTTKPGTCVPLHWDFQKDKKEICIRRCLENGSSDWIWSRPISVDGKEGYFAAKMYRPSRHEQYIARIAVCRLAGGVGAIVIEREDRRTPPYRIVNTCRNRSIAFRQNGVQEKTPWLVRPGKSTRYSWDDPQSPLRRRCLVVEVIELVSTKNKQEGVTRSLSTSALGPLQTESGVDGARYYDGAQRTLSLKEIRHPTFNLNIDIIQDDVEYQHSKRFKPGLLISVHVDGPTKVVTFADDVSEIHPVSKGGNENANSLDNINALNSKPPRYGEGIEQSHKNVEPVPRNTMDVKIWVKALGLSFVDETPLELAYLLVSGIHFRLDRFDGQQLVVCEVEDVQLDNQLPKAAWPVALWSPLHTTVTSVGKAQPSVAARRKPFFELTVDGEYPHIKNGIGYFRGIYVALQQIQVNADEDFVLRGWAFIQSLLAATGASDESMIENLSSRDGEEVGVPKLIGQNVEDDEEGIENDELHSSAIKRLYVTNLELCPVKVTVSFISSRTSSASGRPRSIIRALLAVLGNVQNAEFRFNSLELQHVFDSVAHFQSLIAEFYIAQGSSQKMALLASNSLIGNPSGLFDSIAIGAKDFFYEPAKAKGSADFIVSIGRGSSSLLTNTVGGLIGSVGEIPRAVAHGLETAVGDREYLAERESIRGGRARAVVSPAQGLFNGALSFGHGIASGAAGLIRDPVQGAVEDGASGFMKGLRKGVIGGVLKPITGALDLIAEPAAGFRSLLVSERNRNSAEPIRPPRTFLGTRRDRLALYDLSSALGNAILRGISGSDSGTKSERLVSWVDFTVTSPVLENESVDYFLWALIRKSTRLPNTIRGQLVDVHGIIQRADKIHAGLVTSRRVLVASLNGHVIWEHPLADVIGTQASIESKAYLSIGVRPVGSSSHAVPPKWEKINCGSPAARDAFNTALKKALSDFGLTGARERAAIYGPNNDFLATPGMTPKSIEMVDFSTADCAAEEELEGPDDEIEEGERHDVFARMNVLGRSRSINKDSVDDELSHRLRIISGSVDTILEHSVRSVRIIIVNRLEYELKLVRSTMESGVWASTVPTSIAPKSIAVLHAHEPNDKVKDVAGSFVYQVIPKNNAPNGSIGNSVIALRFVNPMLTSNAYAVDSPSSIQLSRFGGDKGDNAQVVIDLKSRTGKLTKTIGNSSKLNLTLSPDLLLFGRSDLLPEIVEAKPPKSRAVETKPDTEELVAKLSTLGFSKLEARQALQDCEQNISSAYAKLTGNN